MDLPAKLKAVRARERLTQVEFCGVMQFSLSTYKKYEAGIVEMGAQPLLSITNHPHFKKYALWLVTGEICPECGQISPL